MKSPGSAVLHINSRRGWVRKGAVTAGGGPQPIINMRTHSHRLLLLGRVEEFKYAQAGIGIANYDCSTFRSPPVLAYAGESWDTVPVRWLHIQSGSSPLDHIDGQSV